MRKVLLVTLQDANIGNRLQNYSLQTVLEKMGWCVFNPVYYIPESKMVRLKSSLKAVLYFVLGVKKYTRMALNKKRRKAYYNFNQEYIHNLMPIGFFNIAKQNTQKFSFAITGSDQVWHNWTQTDIELKYFYLLFMDKSKRISYAPSFGFSEVPDNDKAVHIKGIQEIEYLSCRENSGKSIIKNLTNRDAQIVPDPTFLLSRDEWRIIGRKPKYKLPSKYMLVYFLGTKKNDYAITMNRISAERGIKQTDIFNISEPVYYCTVPNEFVWLVEHAECICTDSFHACVFSLIFEKDFMVFERVENNGMDKMFNRIETLMDAYGLNNHIWRDKNSHMINNSDYSEVKQIIEMQVEVGMSFLNTLRYT